jgi:hypothetical protein
MIEKNDSPFINKKYFKEVFDKYNHKLKCEAELTSDDNLGHSDNQDEIDEEEKTFLEE